MKCISCFRKERGISESSINNVLSKLADLVRPQFIDWNEDNSQTYAAINEMGYTTETLMFELMQPCEKMLQQCFWLNQKMPCASLFRVTTSSGGFCCSFNYNSIKGFLKK